MKLIKFGSRHSFYNWFSRKNREKDYLLIRWNYLHSFEEDTIIYRAVDKGKDVGIVFVSGSLYPGEIWIDLFEINKKYYRKSLGTEMFNLLIGKHKPYYIQLQCAVDKGALSFWRKMKFKKLQHGIEDDGVMYRKISKKYYET